MRGGGGEITPFYTNGANKQNQDLKKKVLIQNRSQKFYRTHEKVNFFWTAMLEIKMGAGVAVAWEKEVKMHHSWFVVGGKVSLQIYFPPFPPAQKKEIRLQ